VQAPATEFLPAIEATPIPKVNFLAEEMQATVGGVSIPRYGPEDYLLLISSYDPGSFKYRAILGSRMAWVAFITEMIKTIVDRVCTDAAASGNIDRSSGAMLLASQACRTSIQEILHQSGVQARLDEAVADRAKLFQFIGKFSVQSKLNLGLAGITLPLSEATITSMNKADVAEDEEVDEFEYDESKKESTELKTPIHDGNGKRLYPKREENNANFKLIMQGTRGSAERWAQVDEYSTNCRDHFVRGLIPVDNFKTLCELEPPLDDGSLGPALHSYLMKIQQRRCALTVQNSPGRMAESRETMNNARDNMNAKMRQLESDTDCQVLVFLRGLSGFRTPRITR
jgi:hypothetical protein